VPPLKREDKHQLIAKVKVLHRETGLQDNNNVKEREDQNETIKTNLKDQDTDSLIENPELEEEKKTSVVVVEEEIGELQRTTKRVNLRNNQQPRLLNKRKRLQSNHNPQKLRLNPRMLNHLNQRRLQKTRTQTSRLDDYQKQIKRPTISLPPPRTVEAPAPDNKLFALIKTKDEDLSQKKEKKEEKKEDSTKKVISADQVIEFTRKEEPKSFGRGRGRGGPRERDSPKPNRDNRDNREREQKDRAPKRGPKSPAPNVSDEASFPALNTAVKV